MLPVEFSDGSFDRSFDLNAFRDAPLDAIPIQKTSIGGLAGGITRWSARVHAHPTQHDFLDLDNLYERYPRGGRYVNLYHAIMTGGTILDARSLVGLSHDFNPNNVNFPPPGIVSESPMYRPALLSPQFPLAPVPWPVVCDAKMPITFYTYNQSTAIAMRHFFLGYLTEVRNNGHRPL